MPNIKSQALIHRHTKNKLPKPFNSLGYTIENHSNVVKVTLIFLFQ